MSLALLPLPIGLLFWRLQTAIRDDDVLMIWVVAGCLTLVALTFPLIGFLVFTAQQPRKAFPALARQHEGSIVLLLARATIAAGGGRLHEGASLHRRSKLSAVVVDRSYVTFYGFRRGFRLIAYLTSNGGEVELGAVHVGGIELNAVRFILATDSGPIEVTAAPDRLDRYSQPEFGSLEDLLRAIRLEWAESTTRP